MSLRVFILKRSTVETFKVPFGVLSQKKYDGRYCFVLELVSFRGENISSHAHKAGSWYLSGVLFKISDENSSPFL